MDKLLVTSNLSFSHSVSTCKKNFLLFSSDLKLSFANYLSLEESQICRLGQSYSIFQATLNIIYRSNPINVLSTNFLLMWYLYQKRCQVSFLVYGSASYILGAKKISPFWHLIYLTLVPHNPICCVRENNVGKGDKTDHLHIILFSKEISSTFFFSRTVNLYSQEMWVISAFDLFKPVYRTILRKWYL